MHIDGISHSSLHFIAIIGRLFSYDTFPLHSAAHAHNCLCASCPLKIWVFGKFRKFIEKGVAKSDITLEVAIENFAKQFVICDWKLHILLFPPKSIHIFSKLDVLKSCNSFAI